MIQQTFTTQGLNRLHGLDVIEDYICGLYGQDSYAIHQVSEAQRDDFLREYDRLLKLFRQLRVDNDEFVSQFDKDLTVRSIERLDER